MMSKMTLKSRSWMSGAAISMALASQAADAGVMVHLFQWKYNDIANEVRL